MNKYMYNNIRYNVSTTNAYTNTLANISEYNNTYKNINCNLSKKRLLHGCLSKFSKASIFFCLYITFAFLLSGQSYSRAKEEIFIFSINDLHGYIDADIGNNVPGIAMIFAKYQEMKKEFGADDSNSVFVLAGDNYHGQYLSSYSKGAITSAMLKLFKPKYSAVGNHEFDWGLDRNLFKQWANDGKFEFLSANIIDKSTNKAIFKQYDVMNIGGVKIGFIGLTTEETIKYNPQAGNWLKFLEIEKITRDIAKKLHFEDKVDFIIVLSHLSTYCMGNITSNSTKVCPSQDVVGDTKEIEMLRNIPYIDAIISAHSHNNISGYINGKAAMQACYYGKCIGTLKINTKTRKITPIVEIVPMKIEEKNTKEDKREEEMEDKRRDKREDERRGKREDEMEIGVKSGNNGKISKIKNSERNSNEALEADKNTYSMYTKIKSTINKEKNKYLHKMNNVVCNLESSISSHDIAQKIVDRVIEKYSGEIDFALLNGGVVRCQINKGKVYYYNIYDTVPFDNVLFFGTITGSKLKKAISHTFGMNSRYRGRIAGNISVDKIQDDKLYRVAASNFMFGGGDGYDFSDAKDIVNTKILLRDLLTESLKKNKAKSK